MWDDSLIDYLVKKGYSVTYGARNLRRLIQKEIEDEIARQIVELRGQQVGKVSLTATEDSVSVKCEASNE